MDATSIRINKDDTQGLYQNRIVASTDKDEKKSDNGIIKATELAQKKNSDFLGERQTREGRDELRIKTRAYTKDIQTEKKLARSELNRDNNIDSLNEINKSSADIADERAMVIAEAAMEPGISPEKETEMLADLDARLYEIESARREVEARQPDLNAKLREDRAANNENSNMLEAKREEREQSTVELRQDIKKTTFDMMSKINDEARTEREKSLTKNADKLETDNRDTITQPERTVKSVANQNEAQVRVQEELLNMVGNLRIASEDAKGLAYSSTI